METIIADILQNLNQISVRGIDVELMFVVKHQLRQLQTMLTAVPKKKEAAPDGNDQNNV